MASTNAALYVVVVLAFSMVSGAIVKSPCEDLDPTIRKFTHDFINNTCLYIRQGWNDWEESKKECESLEQYPHKWHLVELKTESVQAAFHRFMTENAGGRYSFWMGLAREDLNESGSRDAWANPSKWRWISDNSTLLSSSSSPVQWHDDDPNGWRLSWSELCVMVFGKQDPNEPTSYWLDAPCSGYKLWNNPFLVCESMDVSTTTISSTATTTTTTAPTKPETNSSCPCQCQTTQVPRQSETNPWKWVAIALAIIVIAVVVTYLGYRAFQYHRNRQSCILSEDWIALHST